jgi:hypothetical protein
MNSEHSHEISQIGGVGANFLQKGEFDRLPRSGIMAGAREEVSA